MVSPLDPEDMDKLNHSINALRSLGGEEIDIVIAEIERLRAKLEQITNGETVLIMSDDDRATRVQDLDDASLAAWSRWIFLNMETIRKTVDAKAENQDAITLGAMQGVIGLSLMTFLAGNSHVSYLTKNVTFAGRELGNWQVDVKQMRKADSAETSSTTKPVMAEVYSDDWKSWTQFDIRPLLLQIDLETLVELAVEDWRGNQAADEIAVMAGHYDEGVRDTFAYIRTSEQGFECTVDGARVLEWLKDHKPDMWQALTNELEKKGKYNVR